MISIKHNQIDCDHMGNVLRKQGVPFVETDLTGMVPHAGYGGAARYEYVSPKTGEKVFILEVNGLYAPDAYVAESWFFLEDFTVEQATEFIQQQREKPEEAP